MESNFGPEWAWDWNRPEAIEARRQIREGYIQRQAQAQSVRVHQEVRDLLADLRAKCFQLVAVPLRYIVGIARWNE